MKIVLTLQNMELQPAIQLLQSMKLKGKESRNRSKLVKRLQESLEEYARYEKDLLVENGLSDGKGGVIPESDMDPDKKENYLKEQKKLLEEKVSIEGGVYVHNIAGVKDILKKYDGEWSGVDAEIYDRLLDEFEKNEETEVEEEAAE